RRPRSTLFPYTTLFRSSCGTTIEGRFQASPLSRLTAEQRDFVVTFLKVRGNLREMERELGVSYPTVRNRLDGVLKALGYEVEREDRKSTRLNSSHVKLS